MKVAVIGFGNRARAYLGNYRNDERVEFVAVCEKDPARLQVAVEKWGFPKERAYLNEDEFFAQGKLADLLIVSTQDRDHFGHAMKALEVGYDLQLEKPISDSYERCRAIYDKAEKLGRRVFVCHVLRYAPFFRFIYDTIASGKIGDVMSINLTENVCYWHQAHSYVRGNWGVTETSTPMILAKCCHDLDIIYWLMNGKKCEAVTSFGSLVHFKRENAPEGSTDKCIDCPHLDTCAYNPFRFYEKNHHWMHPCFADHDDTKFPEKVQAKLREKDCKYSRCVYKCDNTAVDHQVVNMLYEGGATAHLTMTAFSDKGGRDIHVHGTKGDIVGSMKNNIVTVTEYGKQPEEVNIAQLMDGHYGHGGGDSRLVNDLIALYTGGKAKGLTSIKNSLPSHAIGYAAEQSRLNGGAVIKPEQI